MKMTLVEKIQEFFDPVIAEVGEVQLVSDDDKSAGVPYYQLVVRYRNRKPKTHLFYKTGSYKDEQMVKECRDTMLQKQKRQQTKMTTIERICEYFDPAISSVGPLCNDGLSDLCNNELSDPEYSFVVEYMFRQHKVYDVKRRYDSVFREYVDNQEYCRDAIAAHNRMKQKMARQKRNRAYAR